MRYQRALIPTLKEAPSDATNRSHVLLLRAGYVRRVGAGIYSYLPLGVRVLRRVESIVRQEMDRAGALEVSLPALLPSDYFKETGRWDLFGDNLFRLKDRKGTDYHLGPTHEEIITDLARREIHSYRDMPKNLYQIQTKFRDEPRPRGGLLRCREFSMKDAYSFDATEENAKLSYEKMRVAYTRIFDRMGLSYRMVSADSGAMGGSGSAEFQVLVQSGEDAIAACSSCQYAANLEVAETPAATPQGDPQATPAIETVDTPKARTIEEVSGFLKADPARFLKSLIYVAGQEMVMVVVRGDHEINEIKLARALGVSDVFLAGAEDVKKATGAAVGFAGPAGFNGKLLVDRDAARVVDGISGANISGKHFLHVQYGRDFQGQVMSLRSVRDGDACPSCGAPLQVYRGIEAGHIFLLGTHYSKQMGANFLSESGENLPVVMGCYGIGVSRLVATAVEQFNDDDGITWPMSLSPYHVHIVQLGAEPEVTAAVAELESGLEAEGLDVLVDDREERPGVKFKDADLLGIPLRVTIGKKSLEQGSVELKARSERDPKKAELIATSQAVHTVVQRVRAQLDALTPEPAP